MLYQRIPSNCCKLIRRNSTTSSISPKWQSVVGLEVHAQINSKSKLFSGASTSFQSPVNTNVALFDCATPGTLPVLNKKCVELGVLTALALNCRVNPVSTFDRKHYFYADIPAGYQITQQRHPLAINGELAFHVYTPGIHKQPYKTTSRIKQLQLEQDSGKSLHDSDKSLVDLNRAGVPLMELVFEPDLKDGEEAAALIKELIAILERIGSCSCKLEEGALRVDANVSIHQKNEPFGTRTEIKNIGSVRGVAHAITYEIQRQITIKANGGQIVNETRAWDAAGKATVAMRDKEEVQDYRYMPEPNLPPLHIAIGPITRGVVNADDLRKEIPELPESIRQRLEAKAGLTFVQALTLVHISPFLNIVESCLTTRGIDAKALANILLNNYTKLLHKNNLEPEQVEANADFFVEMMELLQEKVINHNIVNDLLEELIAGATETPKQIVDNRGWRQIIDEEQLRKLCESVIKENIVIVEQYKKGKTKVFKALLNNLYKKSNNRADMAKCTVIMKELLNK